MYSQLSTYILTIVRPVTGWVALSLCLGLGLACEASLSPVLLKIIVDKLAAAPADALFSALMWPVALFIGVMIARALLRRGNDLVERQIFPNMRRNIALSSFEQILGQSHQYFQNHLAGSIQSKITDLINSIPYMLSLCMQTVMQLATLVIAVFTLYQVSPLLGLGLLIWSIIFAIVVCSFSRQIQRQSRICAESRSQYQGTLVDSIANASTWRLFSRQATERAGIRARVDTHIGNEFRLRGKIIGMHCCWDLTIIAMLVGLLLVALLQFQAGALTVGDVILVVSLSSNVYFPMCWLSGELLSFADQLGRSRQALEVLATPHQVVDVPKVDPMQIRQGQIEFQEVSYQYDASASTINHLNLTIEAGTKVGLVGFSGCGKTTLINLVLRLFDPTQGQILIDGQPLHLHTQLSIREQICVIPQQTELFHRSLWDNIAYAKPDACYEEVVDAAKLSHCDEFIQQLPDGYQTLVGERGVKLSGGQRQRVAIARALLKNAPILIMDEATSALDSITEQAIQQVLFKFMQNRTTLVIAHRLATLAEMDRILVLHQGTVVEDGAIEELLQVPSLFQRLWKLQVNGTLPVMKSA